MGNATYVEQLVQKEPWRAGQGWLVNALDPTWLGVQDDIECDGTVEWEKGSKWWYCTKCGYCGFWARTQHKAVRHPYNTLLRNIRFFLKKREEQGYTPQQAILQLAHAAGAVTKLLMEHPPDKLSTLIEKIREVQP